MHFQNWTLQFANKALLHLSFVGSCMFCHCKAKGKMSLRIIIELSKGWSCHKEPCFHLLFCLVKQQQDISVRLSPTAPFEIKVVCKTYFQDSTICNSAECANWGIRKMRHFEFEQTADRLSDLCLAEEMESVVALHSQLREALLTSTF